ncbi:MAG: GNAT family N-acetyltransferase [Pseudomonadales bacterium]|nr:GNAT family N-acetyltransferase [Pseudomonadales bacterium]
MIASNKKRRISAVSQVIKIISATAKKPVLKVDLNDEEDFNFIVATDIDSRRKAYELGYKVYNESGYIHNEDKVCVNSFDGGKNVFTLLVETKEGKAVGTVTLNFEAGDGLPCDQIFNEELFSLRKMNRRLAEITRLAIAPEYRTSKTILLRMFHFIFIHAFHNMKQTDFLVEVHPRHLKFYTKLFCFQQIGEAKPCERVNGSPGILLSTSLKYLSNQVKKFRDNKNNGDSKIPRFARNFYGEAAQNKVMAFLKGKDSSWTEEEFEMYRPAVSCVL